MSVKYNRTLASIKLIKENIQRSKDKIAYDEKRLSKQLSKLGL